MGVGSFAAGVVVGITAIAVGAFTLMSLQDDDTKWDLFPEDDQWD